MGVEFRRVLFRPPRRRAGRPVRRRGSRADGHPAIARRHLPRDDRPCLRCRHGRPAGAVSGHDGSEPMSTAINVAARPAAALPSLARVSLSRTGLELKSFFRRREAVVFTFSLPVVLLIIFGSIFHGTVAHTGVSYRLYF